MVIGLVLAQTWHRRWARAVGRYYLHHEYYKLEDLTPLLLLVMALWLVIMQAEE